MYIYNFFSIYNDYMRWRLYIIWLDLIKLKFIKLYYFDFFYESKKDKGKRNFISI